ncbi:RNA polymerase-binding protein DksA [Ralstonia pseudosolanacearum]|uniref:RNA polymerase-binding protein DksA n=1 Tax=Ralstonia pseudosolanacearum TaxID=1310165 RepID=UPI0021AD59A8|nr:RNA polymerase-binding protein DksA [Ralstonia pseudosolanacearum]
MVTSRTKDGRGANGGGQPGTVPAAAQAAPATRNRAAGGAAAGKVTGGTRSGKPAASQNMSGASPREDNATADTARDLPGSSAATMSSKKLLTEAEILKMGDKDYMNEAQLAFFKDRLEKLRDDILKNAGQTTEHLRETVIVPDPADRATIEEEHALELRTRDRERKLLKKVEQSIARIDEGNYGYCDETGEPIGIPRLLARPTATLTLEAQERREKRQKLFGD